MPRCAGASVRRTRTGRQQADCHHRRRAAAQRHTRPSMLGRRGRVRSTYGSMIRNRAFKIHLRYYLNPDTPRIHVFYRIHSTRYITIQQDTYPIGNPTKKVGPPPLRKATGHCRSCYLLYRALKMPSFHVVSHPARRRDHRPRQRCVSGAAGLSSSVTRRSSDLLRAHVPLRRNSEDTRRQ